MNLRPISIPAPSIREPGSARAAAPAVPEAASAEPAAESRSLWDLLTPAERDFFSRIEALGSLSYRPGGRRADPPAAPTGQRIDVRG